MKENRNQDKNLRDLGITYILAFLTYWLVSMAGALAISNKSCTNTLIDCYLKDWTILFVEVTYLLSKIGNFPIMIEIGRTRILNTFLTKISERHFKMFNICFMIFAATVCILSPVLPLSVLMGLVGAVVCYFFIYFLPTKLHFSCLYPESRKEGSLL